VDPPSIRRLAMTIVYASIAHCSPVIDAPRSRRMSGSATFTIVASIETTRRLRQQMARTTF